MWRYKPHDTTNQEYLYLYTYQNLFCGRYHPSSQSKKYRRSIKIVHDGVIRSFVFCFGSDAHKIIQYLFLCFVWFIYVALWNQIDSSFSFFCIVLYQVSYLGNAASSFEKVFLFTRPIVYLITISSYSQIENIIRKNMK